MFDYKLLQALAAVVEEGGFDKASQILNITQSAVSQRIKLLEDQIGSLLVTRTLPPRATGEGKFLLKHYIQVKSLEADLARSLDTNNTKGFQVFSVGINADSLATWFFPAITDFLAAHPILLDLKVDDQDETHKLLRNGEVMGCISSEKTPVQGCRVSAIGTMTYRLVATRDFCRTYFPDGLTEESVRSAPAVIFNRKDELHARFLETVPGLNIKGLPCHYVPSSEKFVAVLVSGLAYGMAPDLQAAPLLETGQLREVAPGSRIDVPLFWHRWNLSSRLLDRFSKAIVKNAVIC